MSGTFELERTYRFEAAHHLPQAPEGHRCRRLHGHSYRLEVQVTGTADESQGWVVDFAEIDAAVKPLYDRLEHQLLNDVPGLENPTSELLARWLWEKLEPQLPGLSAISVHETDRSRCTYRGGEPPAGEAFQSMNIGHD